MSSYDRIERCEELPDVSVPMVVIRHWYPTMDSLSKNPQAAALLKTMGYTPYDIYDIVTHRVENIEYEGQRGEHVFHQPLWHISPMVDRSLIHAHTKLKRPQPTEMTQFLSGGEVIKVLNGIGVLTYAAAVTEGVIRRQDLRTLTVYQGDLIISTCTPNTWKDMTPDFVFMYFVGNPVGERTYEKIPKIALPIC
jgi:hypothetical protein